MTRVGVVFGAFVAVIAAACWPAAQRARAAVVAVAAAAAIAVATTPLAAAGVWMRVGADCDARRDFGCAADANERAAALDAAADLAWTRAGSANLARADAAGDARTRDEWFGRAARDFASAQAVNPYHYHHPHNLAVLERRWARGGPPATRADHLSRAADAMAAAIAIAPTAGRLFAEFGNLDLERGRAAEALGHLERAAELEASDDAARVVDAWLTSEHADPRASTVRLRAAQEFAQRGLPALAALYDRPSPAPRPDQSPRQ